MLKYLLCFVGCVILLSLVTVFCYPFFVSTLNVPAAICLTISIMIAILSVWNLLVSHFDLDNRGTSLINTDKEKLFIIHEHRRLIELDYMDFYDSIQENIRNKKYK